MKKKLKLIACIALPIFLAIGVSAPAMAQQSLEAQKIDDASASGRIERHIKLGTYDSANFDNVKYQQPITIKMEFDDHIYGNPDIKVFYSVLLGEKGEILLTNHGPFLEFYFDYKKKTGYWVNPQEHTLVSMRRTFLIKRIGLLMDRGRMPLWIHPTVKSPGKWLKAQDSKVINGHTCQLYIYTFPKSEGYYQFWIAQDVQTRQWEGKYMLGGMLYRCMIFHSLKGEQNPDYPQGLIVRSTLYNNEGKVMGQINLKTFKNSVDKKYFDYEDFKREKL